jgi:hypothetical protein
VRDRSEDTTDKLLREGVALLDASQELLRALDRQLRASDAAADRRSPGSAPPDPRR